MLLESRRRCSRRGRAQMGHPAARLLDSPRSGSSARFPSRPRIAAHLEARAVSRVRPLMLGLVRKAYFEILNFQFSILGFTAFRKTSSTFDGPGAERCTFCPLDGPSQARPERSP